MKDVCVCTCVSVCMFVYLFEVSILALLPVHHVVEDWDHDVSYFHLRDQRDSQERTDHTGDEMDLILTYNNHTYMYQLIFNQTNNQSHPPHSHIRKD